MVTVRFGLQKPNGTNRAVAFLNWLMWSSADFYVDKFLRTCLLIKFPRRDKNKLMKKEKKTQSNSNFYIVTKFSYIFMLIGTNSPNVFLPFNVHCSFTSETHF